MTFLALLLILAAAFIHATWNFYAKRVGGGAAFVWLFGSVGVIFYAPVIAGYVLWQRPEVSLAGLLFIAGSGLIHLGYFLMLQYGYRVGDLSLVYPLARGTGPTLATLAAIAFFGERPSPLAMIGAALVVVSVFLLAGKGWQLGGVKGTKRNQALFFGLATGTIIACYTLWDAHAVSRLSVSPLLINWGAGFIWMTLLAPYAARHWPEVTLHWREHRRQVFIIALLNPLSYILVLTAFSFSPVSYIAPAREISILIGTAMGTRLLAEGETRSRLAAAALMVLGVAALALG